MAQLTWLHPSGSGCPISLIQAAPRLWQAAAAGGGTPRGVTPATRDAVCVCVCLCTHTSIHRSIFSPLLSHIWQFLFG